MHIIAPITLDWIPSQETHQTNPSIMIPAATTLVITLLCYFKDTRTCIQEECTSF